jgi:hypothetical protein
MDKNISGVGVRRMKKILVILVAVGILAAFISAIPNELAGWRQRSVELAINLDSARLLGEDAGLSVEEVISLFKDKGATAVWMREATVRRYLIEGRLALMQGGEIKNALLTGQDVDPVLREMTKRGEINAQFSYIITTDSFIAQRVRERGEVAFGGNARILNENPYIVEVGALKTTVEPIQLGFDPEVLAILQRLDMRLVGRPNNFFMGSEAAVRQLMGEYARLPQGLLSGILFDWEEAAGYPDYLEQAAEVINEAGIRVGIVEFAERHSGIEELLALTDYRSMRMHPLMTVRPVEEAVNAFMERGVQVLLISFDIERRPYDLEGALEVVENITDEMGDYGFVPGEAYTLEQNWGHAVLHLLMILGVAAAAVLAAQMMSFKMSWLLWAAGILLFVALAGLYALRQGMALQLTSIAAAMVFPVLAIVTQQYLKIPAGGIKQPVKFALLAMLRTFAIGIIGGIMVAGLTSTPYFTSGTALFRGVKLMHVLPFIPLAFAAYAALFAPKVQWTIKEMVKHLLPLLKNPVLVLHLVLMAAGAVVLFIYVGRTGHQMELPVLQLEIYMRWFLDEVLVVRPRFKEFLIAYPAALLGLTLAAKGYRGPLTYGLIVIGGMSTISMLNTFMHFTNPMLMSSAAIRSLNGLWLGIVIGLVPVLFLPYAEKWLAGWRKDN